MKLPTIILFSLLVLNIFFFSSFKKDKFSSNARLRTDGYYVYDNHVDTFIFIPDSKELFDIAQKTLKEMGIITHKKSRCIPDGLIPLDGSSYLSYLAFFSDSTGTVLEGACKDDTTKAEMVQIIMGRKNGYDTCAVPSALFSINRVHFIDDDDMTFYVGTDERPDHYSCRIYRDSIVAKVFVVGNQLSRNSPNAHRVYYFMPYDTTGH